MLRIRRISRFELPVDTEKLARFLIGKSIVHDTPVGRLSGRIVETEAYVIGDNAAHSFIGITPRNRSLFLKRGHAYVYFIYGNWYCLNVSGEAEGIGGGVLIRAVEILEGKEVIGRGRMGKEHRWASGPGRLADAFGVDRRFDGADLCSEGPLWLGGSPRRTTNLEIGVSVRIGLSKGTDRKLRFYERGNPSVSGPKRLRS